jgi:hypothetical protein
MMITPSGITISFAGTRGGGDDSRPVVVRISGFESASDELPIMRQMVVPAGESVEEKLPQGLYNVELTLPSGRIIQRNVRIHEGSNETYQFFDDFAKPTGFSLQEAVGRRAGAVLDYAVASARRGMMSRDDDDDDAPPRRAFKSRSPGPGPERMQEPTVSLGIGQVVTAEDSWVDSHPWRDVQPDERQGAAAIWRISYADDRPPDAATRQWARVKLNSGIVELVSLPLPWFCLSTGGFINAEVLVDAARTEGAATRVAVRDGYLAGLLAFLDRGQATAARPMLDALEQDDLIEETISKKMANPLAACAAAYVGLAVYPPEERERWDAWLGNLMSRFEGVPDAAIVHARRLMLRPTDRESNAEAALVLRRACDAGVPYFSAGVGLLREMLMQLSPDFPDLKPLADKAAQLAARVDEQQVFTVLRYTVGRISRP